MPTVRIPTLAEVDRIAGLAEPVVRNLQITQCYHELALALMARTGQSANWCTFAAWASCQAGVTIRKEDLGRALEGLRGPGLAADPAVERLRASARALGARADGAFFERLVGQVWNPLEPFERASEAVARGNLKVFAEIGRAFARFYEVCLADSVFDAAKIAAFCDEFKPGDPPDGQQYLRQAFTRYYQALFEPDLKKRAELLLLANIEVGYHEQTRLQPEIVEALDAPVGDAAAFKRRLAAAIVRQGDWRALAAWVGVRLVGRRTLLDAAAEHFVGALQREARLVTTEFLMTIEMPRGRKLRLGDDLRAAYPPALRQLANADLLALLARVDPTPDAVRGTGAADWGDLPQRLHFIVDMFRCYAEAREIFRRAIYERAGGGGESRAAAGGAAVKKKRDSLAWQTWLVAGYAVFIAIWLALKMALGDRFWPLAILNTAAEYLAVPLIPLAIIAALSGRRRLLVGLLAIPTLIFVWLFGAQFLPRLQAAPDGPRLKLMTYNVLFSNEDFDAIAASIRAVGPDIIAFEELNYPHAEGLPPRLAVDYPYWVFTPSGKKVSDTGIMSRYPIVESESLSPTPFNTSMRAVVDVNGRRLNVFVAHLTANNYPLSETPLWAAQRFAARASETRYLATVLAAMDGPAVLLCDCNLSATSEAYATLNAVMGDSFREAGWGLGHTIQPFAAPVALQRIDYIWHSGEFFAAAAGVGEPGGSDHRPVWAELVWPP